MGTKFTMTHSNDGIFDMVGSGLSPEKGPELLFPMRLSVGQQQDCYERVTLSWVMCVDLVAVMCPPKQKHLARI